MAKKSKKVEKETRRLLETIDSLTKKDSKGHYKFKSKNKKMIKKVKRTCPHWILRKGKEVPIVELNPDKPGYWKCSACKATFPIKPIDPKRDADGNIEYNAYKDVPAQMLELVNQIQFYSVKLGGNADDTKMFLNLKRDLSKFPKVAEQVLKHIRKRQEFEQKKKMSSAMEQFSNYPGYSYNM